LFLFVSAAGFIIANSVAGALAAYPHQAGAVSALIGSLHYGSGMLGSALVGRLADGTPWPMGLVIAITSVGGLLCTRMLRAAPATSRR
jgi:MFS transporter, DHA1 family, multidrug resistance protein